MLLIESIFESGKLIVSITFRKKIAELHIYSCIRMTEPTNHLNDFNSITISSQFGRQKKKIRIWLVLWTDWNQNGASDKKLERSNKVATTSGGSNWFDKSHVNSNQIGIHLRIV